MKTARRTKSNSAVVPDIKSVTIVVRSNPQIVSKKHFQQDGKWIVKPSKTEVLICVCGNKYIKTRELQTLCIQCMFRTRPQGTSPQGQVSRPVAK